MTRWARSQLDQGSCSLSLCLKIILNGITFHDLLLLFLLITELQRVR